MTMYLYYSQEKNWKKEEKEKEKVLWVRILHMWHVFSTRRRCSSCSQPACPASQTVSMLQKWSMRDENRQNTIGRFLPISWWETDMRLDVFRLAAGKCQLS